MELSEEELGLRYQVCMVQHQSSCEHITNPRAGNASRSAILGSTSNRVWVRSFRFVTPGKSLLTRGPPVDLAFIITNHFKKIRTGAALGGADPLLSELGGRLLKRI